MPILWSLLAVAAIIAMVLYNRLVHLRVRVEAAWADIEAQLKKRYDLIPNLVETVKGYAIHEQGVFEAVTTARAAALGAADPTTRVQADNQLSGALKNLFAVAENYPELKASSNFRDLQTVISGVEDQIQMARRQYNAVVRDYNTKLFQFPSNLVASFFNFQKRDFFDMAEVERTNVVVKF